MLDVYELCTSELQEKMLTIRSRFKEVEDKKLEKQQQKVRHLISTLYPQKSSFHLHAATVFPVGDEEARRSQGAEIRTLFLPRRYVGCIRFGVLACLMVTKAAKRPLLLQIWAPTTAATTTSRPS